ncbi:ATP-grasp domain-containing protein [Priestia megaterium]|uniref:ATP-grasp domain-containing protein n=1 Tax=Priestia megaterium TaxID=1404 RepID=UPI002D7E1B41|nr:ATP-grasp domain-containing protein [Priestia megaterium]MEB4861269.1 ATP-grasp domain-containing protein [Priestia megaterium]
MAQFIIVEPIPFLLDEIIRMLKNYESHEICIITNDQKIVKDYPQFYYISMNILNEDNFPQISNEISLLPFEIDTIFTASEKHIVATEKFKAYLGFSSNEFENFNVLRDKALMKKIWNSKSLPTSNYIEYTNEKDVSKITFPCVIKPKSSYGSTGVKLIENLDELKQQFLKIKMWEKATNDDNALRGTLIEEYFSGEEFTVDTFWYKGKPVAAFVMKKYGTNPPYFSDRLYYIAPDYEENNIYEEIISIANKAVYSIGMRTGATHVEIKHNNNSYSLIEAAFRPGGHTTVYQLFKKQFNIDVFHFYLCVMLGNEEKISSYIKSMKEAKQKLTFYYDMGYDEFGIVKAIEGLDKLGELPGVHEIDVMQLTEIGGFIGPETLSSGNKLCLITGYYTDIDTLLKHTNNNFGLKLQTNRR